MEGTRDKGVFDGRLLGHESVWALRCYALKLLAEIKHLKGRLEDLDEAEVDARIVTAFEAGYQAGMAARNEPSESAGPTS